MASPLEHRPPNPPAVFVGREAELEALQASTPLTLVWGPGGVGKSALIARFVETAGDEFDNQAVWLGARKDHHPNALLLAVVRALGDASASLDSDNRTALAAELIERLEAASAILVIDDLHRANRDDDAFVLDVAARYLRRGRLIATSRIAHAVPDAATALAIGALPGSDLAALATKLRPATSEMEARSLAADSKGSPWRLRALVAGEAPSGRDGDLPAAVLGDPFLRVLTALDRPVPAVVLRECGVAVPNEEAIDSLLERGVIERSFAGLRLHEVTRGLLGSNNNRELEGRELADGLVKHANVAAVAAGCVMLLRNEWTDGLDAVFENRLGDLIGAGLGEEMCAQLRGHLETNLVVWRIRFAVAVDAVWVLDSIPEPPSDDVEILLAWARMLRLRGDVSGASQILSELGKRNITAHQAFEVGKAQSYCLYNLDHIEEALAIERDLTPTNPTQAAALYSGTAMDAAYVGELELARRSLLEAEALIGANDELASVEHRIFLAISSWMTGNLRAARTHLDAGYAAATTRRARLGMIETDAIISMSFDLNRADRLIAELEARAALTTNKSFVLARRLDLRLRRGELSNLKRMFAALIESDDELAVLQARSMALSTAELSMLTGDELPTGSRPPGKHVSTAERRLVEARYRAQWGEGSESIDTQAISEHRVRLALPALAMAELAAAENALSHDLPSVVATLGDFCRQAKSAGYLFETARGLALLADAYVIEGQLENARESAAQLGEMAATLGSPRFGARARFIAAAFAQERPNWSALEALAASEQVSPVAARRARWLLGEQVRLNRIETRLVRRLTNARASLSALRTHARETVGIDYRRFSLWTVNQHINIGDGLLFRLLVALAEGGSATKEQLVLSVWEESEYHPLRHDAKLKNAVRKLRTLIEDDAKSPRRIVTTDDGYAVGDDVQLRFAK